MKSLYVWGLAAPGSEGSEGSEGSACLRQAGSKGKVSPIGDEFYMQPEAAALPKAAKTAKPGISLARRAVVWFSHGRSPVVKVLP